MIKFLDKSWNGKNKHSVYTRCNECKTFGICFPQDDKCGNCGSDDTMQYWDAETISQELTEIRREAFESGWGYGDVGIMDSSRAFSDYTKSKEGER